jgi:hypothetical protein
MNGAAVLALLAVSGCSTYLVHGPPMTLPDSGPIECTNNYVLPVMDAVVGIGVGVASWYVVARPGPEEPGTGFADVVVGGIGGIAIPVAALVSAARGFSRVSRCRDAEAVLAASTAVPRSP